MTLFTLLLIDPVKGDTSSSVSLFQISKTCCHSSSDERSVGVIFLNLFLILSQRCSISFRSGLTEGQLSMITIFVLKNSLVIYALWAGALSCIKVSPGSSLSSRGKHCHERLSGCIPLHSPVRLVLTRALFSPVNMAHHTIAQPYS